MNDSPMTGLHTRSNLPADIADRAIEVARALHAHPEVSWHEQASSALLRAQLAEAGFVVSDVDGAPTAFVARAGEGATRVALCLEYDALPGVGHGCGHHLIAGAGLAAALWLAPAMADAGFVLEVVGCPAEERGGGKVALLQAGVFDGVAAAVMVHFVPDGYPVDPTGTTSYAVARERVTYTGRAAHAASAPHLGVNAADAAVVAQVAVGLLRQQLPGDVRVGLHVSHGGESTNIIPALCTVDVECRALSWEGLVALRDRVHACFRAGAIATGCEMSVAELEPPYMPLRQDPWLAGVWADSLRERGYVVTSGPMPSLASTDMGNVSAAVPSIHPWLSIPGLTAAIHTEAFARESVSPTAFETMIEAAEGLADTILAAGGRSR